MVQAADRSGRSFVLLCIPLRHQEIARFRFNNDIPVTLPHLLSASQTPHPGTGLTLCDLHTGLLPPSTSTPVHALNIMDIGFGHETSETKGRWTCIVQNAWLIAAVVVLIVCWDGDGVCDEQFRQRWRWWLLVATMMPAMYIVIVAAVAAYEVSAATRGSCRRRARTKLLAGSALLFGQSKCGTHTSSPTLTVSAGPAHIWWFALQAVYVRHICSFLCSANLHTCHNLR